MNKAIFNKIITIIFSLDHVWILIAQTYINYLIVLVTNILSEATGTDALILEQTATIFEMSKEDEEITLLQFVHILREKAQKRDLN